MELNFRTIQEGNIELHDKEKKWSLVSMIENGKTPAST